ncbi:Peptidase M20 [Penicillium verhagenii]|uniref:Peptidase M20 n=1 Tax=Penicillium verhagenii TaxID=1562060 RepID=UPI002544E018|nr:Peptidase M20 [Penicillium verhagenii]KAJ5921275.1 Peptidase M20 [Penicillium verhagenii]
MKKSYLWSLAVLTGITHALEPQQQLLDSQHEIPAPTTHLDSIIASSPLLSFHRDIVKIPSISENERDVGEYIINFLTSHNFTVEKQIVTPGNATTKERFNVYAYVGENRFPDVLLTSHIDTVPPFIEYSLHAPKSASSSFNREDLIIAGRGTVDAKASVAAITFAALETLQQDPDASLGLLFDVGEEKSGIGMKHFSNSDLNPDPASYSAIIFGEPTELKLVAGHKGNLAFKIISQGKAAHSGYPHLGKSAISAILPVLQYIDTLENLHPDQGGLLRSEKFNGSTLNIGVVSGGQAGNIVPAYAEAVVSVRLAAGTPDDTREIIQRAVDAVTGGEGGVFVDFGDRGGAPPQHLDVDVEGFDVITVNYGTDVPALEIHGGGKKVKRYLYGPGTIHVAHGDDEAISVGELERAVQGYKRLIKAAL